MIPFEINGDFLDELTAKAKASERKRMHYDLRDSEDEDSMRMLNAIEPESVIPVHRHSMTSEDVVVIRGCVEEVLYEPITEMDSSLAEMQDAFPMGMDAQDIMPKVKGLKEVARVRLEPGSNCIACHVPKGMYHTCQSLASGSVIIEFKATRYDEKKSEEIFSNSLGDLKKNIEYLIGMERQSGSMDVISPLYVSRMLNVPIEEVEKCMKEMGL